LHNEELHNFYSSPNIIRQIKLRRMGWAEHVARMAEERKMYRVFGGPEGKAPIGRLRRRWEDGIRMYLGETGWSMWIGFDWLRIGTGGGLLCAVMNLRVLVQQS
jgi:hypothetical protein